MFLAYNANTGLPFVPTRELKVDIANGSNLVVGNDVREGGFRIGLVSGPDADRAAQRPGRRAADPAAEQRYGNVPVDSTASIRPLSVLGSKYVDLHKGDSPT